jgi:UDP-N-acetylglucosamine acyltransferase
MIHATAIIEDGAQLGPDCIVHAHAIVTRHCVIGERAEIHPFAVIGGDPQDLSFQRSTASGVTIGARTVLREHVTVNRATNAALLAGHVHVGDRVFFGGGAAVHQFSRIGEGAMVAGLARITRDVAPFTMAAERDEVIGLNVVGLRRRGCDAIVLAELKRAYRDVYTDTGNLRAQAAAALASAHYQSAEASRFLQFFAGGKRGFIRPLTASADSGS